MDVRGSNKVVRRELILRDGRDQPDQLEEIDRGNLVLIRGERAVGSAIRCESLELLHRPDHHLRPSFREGVRQRRLHSQIQKVSTLVERDQARAGSTLVKKINSTGGKIIPQNKSGPTQCERIRCTKWANARANGWGEDAKVS